MRKILISCAIFATMLVTAGVRNLSVEVSSDEDGFTVISYVLSGDAAVITFDVLTNGVTVGAKGLSRVRGDVYKLIQPGTDVRVIRWRADRDLPKRMFESGDFDVRVTAWPTNDPPDYMVVDLVTNATVRMPQISYYPTIDHLPAGGLSNRNYARNKIVMRKIPAANRIWRMGSSTAATDHDVMLTENYYIGIYELTVGQMTYMSGSSESVSKAATYYEVPRRAAYNVYRGASWPTDGHTGASGDIAILRDYTGLEFDLPTEAQWEFAARSGEYNYTLYTGTNVVVTDNLAPMLDEVAWYGYNSTNANGVCVLQCVGLLKPNAYGLYDVLGNVDEWCLDYWRALPGRAVTEVDPVGGASGNRILRGGCYNQSATQCSLEGRRNINPSWSNDGKKGVDGSAATAVFGVRLVCPAIAVR